MNEKPITAGRIYPSTGKSATGSGRWKLALRDRWLYVMLLPGILYFILFKYLPMWGVLIAFQNYQPFRGFLYSDWVGTRHFIRFFSEPAFWMLFRNTVMLALYNLIFFSRCPSSSL